MASPLKPEFDYYVQHQSELLKQYNGRFIVIKDRRVIGDYPDQATAIAEAAKQYELGTFLVQKVEPGDTAYSSSFHSRVAFS